MANTSPDPYNLSILGSVLEFGRRLSGGTGRTLSTPPHPNRPSDDGYGSTTTLGSPPKPEETPAAEAAPEPESSGSGRKPSGGGSGSGSKPASPKPSSRTPSRSPSGSRRNSVTQQAPAGFRPNRIEDYINPLRSTKYTPPQNLSAVDPRPKSPGYEPEPTDEEAYEKYARRLDKFTDWEIAVYETRDHNIQLHERRRRNVKVRPDSREFREVHKEFRRLLDKPAVSIEDILWTYFSEATRKLIVPCNRVDRVFEPDRWRQQQLNTVEYNKTRQHADWQGSLTRCDLGFKLAMAYFGLAVAPMRGLVDADFDDTAPTGPSVRASAAATPTAATPTPGVTAGSPSTIATGSGGSPSTPSTTTSLPLRLARTNQINRWGQRNYGADAETRDVPLDLLTYATLTGGEDPEAVRWKGKAGEGTIDYYDADALDERLSVIMDENLRLGIRGGEIDDDDDAMRAEYTPEEMDIDDEQRIVYLGDVEDNSKVSGLSSDMDDFDGDDFVHTEESVVDSDGYHDEMMLDEGHDNNHQSVSTTGMRSRASLNLRGGAQEHQSWTELGPKEIPPAGAASGVLNMLGYQGGVQWHPGVFNTFVDAVDRLLGLDNRAGVTYHIYLLEIDETGWTKETTAADRKKYLADTKRCIAVSCGGPGNYRSDRAAYDWVLARRTDKDIIFIAGPNDPVPWDLVVPTRHDESSRVLEFQLQWPDDPARNRNDFAYLRMPPDAASVKHVNIYGPWIAALVRTLVPGRLPDRPGYPAIPDVHISLQGNNTPAGMGTYGGLACPQEIWTSLVRTYQARAKATQDWELGGGQNPAPDFEPIILLARGRPGQLNDRWHLHLPGMPSAYREDSWLSLDSVGDPLTVGSHIIRVVKGTTRPQSDIISYIETFLPGETMFHQYEDGVLSIGADIEKYNEFNNLTLNPEQVKEAFGDVTREFLEWKEYLQKVRYIPSEVNGLGLFPTFVGLRPVWSANYLEWRDAPNADDRSLFWEPEFMTSEEIVDEGRKRTGRSGGGKNWVSLEQTHGAGRLAETVTTALLVGPGIPKDTWLKQIVVPRVRCEMVDEKALGRYDKDQLPWGYRNIYETPSNRLYRQVLNNATPGRQRFYDYQLHDASPLRSLQMFRPFVNPPQTEQPGLDPVIPPESESRVAPDPAATNVGTSNPVIRGHTVQVTAPPVGQTIPVNDLGPNPGHVAPVPGPQQTYMSQIASGAQASGSGGITAPGTSPSPPPGVPARIPRVAHRTLPRTIVTGSNGIRRPWGEDLRQYAYSNPLTMHMENNIPMAAPPLESLLNIRQPTVPGVSIAVQTPTESRRRDLALFNERNINLMRAQACPYAGCDVVLPFNNQVAVDLHLKTVHVFERCNFCETPLYQHWSKAQRDQHFLDQHYPDIIAGRQFPARHPPGGPPTTTLVGAVPTPTPGGGTTVRPPPTQPPPTTPTPVGHAPPATQPPPVTQPPVVLPPPLTPTPVVQAPPVTQPPPAGGVTPSRPVRPPPNVPPRPVGQAPPPVMGTLGTIQPAIFVPPHPVNPPITDPAVTTGRTSGPGPSVHFVDSDGNIIQPGSESGATVVGRPPPDPFNLPKPDYPSPPPPPLIPNTSVRPPTLGSGPHLRTRTPREPTRRERSSSPILPTMDEFLADRGRLKSTPLTFTTPPQPRNPPLPRGIQRGVRARFSTGDHETQEQWEERVREFEAAGGNMEDVEEGRARLPPPKSRRQRVPAPPADERSAIEIRRIFDKGLTREQLDHIIKKAGPETEFGKLWQRLWDERQQAIARHLKRNDDRFESIRRLNAENKAKKEQIERLKATTGGA